MAAPDHDHHHNHARRDDHCGQNHGRHYAGRDFGAAFAIGTVLNAGFVAAEVVFGLAAHSVALLADAAHNAGDVLALLLAWGAAVLARRIPSLRRTYGWGRASILAALINAVVLLIGVGAIALEALWRFAEPAPVAAGTVIAVALSGVVVNSVTAWLFAHGHEDLNIRATFLHMAADAGVSLGVAAAALAIRLTGLDWIDPTVSLLIAAVIVAGTWSTLRDAVDLAVDAVPAEIAPQEVVDYLAALPGVVEVHDLHIWALSTTETALTAHLVLRPDGNGGELIVVATRELTSRFRIGHATLQMETETLASTCRLRPAHIV